MMDDNLKLIKDFLDRHVTSPPETITLQSSLEEIGIDSLGLLELIFEMEDKYGISLPQDLPAPRTVGDLLELIEKHKPLVRQ